MPEGEEIPDSPVSSQPPGTLVDTPRPKRRRGRPRKVPGSTSTNTQSPDLSSDTEVYCFCRRPDDGRLMVQCEQCDWWFHGGCISVTTQEVADLDQYICPSCMGVVVRKGVSFPLVAIPQIRRPVPPTAGGRMNEENTRRPRKPPDETARHPREQRPPEEGEGRKCNFRDNGELIQCCI